MNNRTLGYKRTSVLVGLILSFVFFIVGCKQLPKSAVVAAKPIERAKQVSLEQDYAALRAQQITKVDYELTFELDETNTRFNGQVVINFELVKNNQAPITVDFDSGEILAVRLNGKAIPWQYEKWFIRFAPELFSAGKNQLEINYSRPYATAGDGLHRFKDLTTGNVYLYSNFEPYNANKMFPHFDQPDIKASYRLSVLAPESWQVISALRESKITHKEKQNLWEFPSTAPISSYIFPLHAGPYQVWEDYSGSVPLRLFARQELKQYVDAQEWFLFTQQSFKFFNQYFDQPYPFVKYDQLIVPDFNSGAMENLGAVTFNEIYVSRGIKTQVERIRHGNVIAHEMAHMWFGNLVTMDWWNGLWLNESFATYMAFLQQAEASEFGDTVWNIFYAGYKQTAYTMDQQVITHPIELPVNNTAEAFTNFDSITYGKGASVLKQLAQFVGEENFRKGVASYLKKHAYENTQLDDFIGEIAQVAEMDLSHWTETWLKQAGLNTIQLDYRCDASNSLMTSLSIQQTAPADIPVLRQQRVQLSFYKMRAGKLQQEKIFPVIYEGAKTDIDVKNFACPDMIYPNAGDWGYVKVALDKKSLQLVREHINQFDVSSRVMLWQSLWDDVVDARMPLTDYLRLVERHLPQELRYEVVSAVTAKLKLTNDYLQLMSSPDKSLKAERGSLEKITFQQMLAAPAGSDVQKLWFDIFAYTGFSPNALTFMRTLLIDTENKNLVGDKKLAGNKKLAGFVLDQDRRWVLLLRLNQFQFKDYLALTAQEQKKDTSDPGVNMALASEAIRPDLTSKEKWFAQITAQQQTYKLASMRIVMANFLPFSQPELRANFTPKLLVALPDLGKHHDERFMHGFFRGITLRACTPASLLQMKQARDQHSELNSLQSRMLKVEVQEDQRCMDMKKLM
ncbi:MAG: aminopeptidase N [Pseudomonadota bacterium]